MKVAFIRIGGKVDESTRSTTTNIVKSLTFCKVIHHFGNDVHVFTKDPSIAEKDGILFFDSFSNYDKIVSGEYQILMVMNGHANFYGGADSPEEFLKYKIINKFPGRVIYLFTDTSLVLKQIYRNIESREWGSKYKIEDIKIVRKDIECISQSKRTDKVREMFAEKEIYLSKIMFFNLEKYPLLWDNPYPVNLEEKEYDIIYGGSWRSGTRQNTMIKFFFGYPDDVKMHVFGNIKLEDFKEEKIKGFRPPTFDKALPNDRYIKEYSKSIANIIISDKNHTETEMITLRIYEAIHAGCVIFIDEDFDRKRYVFQSPILRKFCYVKSRKDVIERINFLKKNTSRIKQIVDLQRKDVYIDKDKFYADFYQLILEETMHHINVDDAYIVKAGDIKDVTNEESEKIKNFKSTYVIPPIKIKLSEFLKYPGFFFLNKNDAKLYDALYYNNIKNAATPPRGNVVDRIVFMGHKPGDIINDQFLVNESAWLFGPSAKLLLRLCFELKIYPYFTNVYKDKNADINGDVTDAIKELETLSIINKNKNIKVLFLGSSYSEYETLMNKLDSALNIECQKIYHPAYLLRNGCPNDMFEGWKNSINKFLGEEK